MDADSLVVSDAGLNILLCEQKAWFRKINTLSHEFDQVIMEK